MMTPVQIKQLPTILHILDKISGEEENLRNNSRWNFLSNLGAEDKFEIKPETPNGPCVLQPTSSCINSYFRGQTDYYDNCVPTIYRDQNKSEIDNFIDCLRVSEFELLLQTHPFVHLIFNEGLVFKNFGKDVHVSLKVDYLGLAQHYELSTNVLDFTSDKWVAAFFATCNKIGKKYVPIDSDSYGVIYRYSIPPECLFSSNENNKISTIGLQPFKRPGEQKGFAFNMEKGENLNNIKGIQKYLFRHDKLAAEIIYNRMNQGNELFPFDELEVLAQKIKTSNKYSNSAFKLTCKKYPIAQMDEDQLIKACISKGIKFTNYPVVKFSKEIKRKFHSNWKKNGKKEFLSKIVYRQYF
ncbi:MAG: FRG domain-containing protein [Prolixibacteraceae bacterium]|nr:FRG domain-containing protein [Prolixibacteraceae bacterium]